IHDVRDLTHGPDGAVWFTEAGSNQIGRITPSGQITTYDVPEPGGWPSKIVSGPDGNLWFTENITATPDPSTPGAYIHRPAYVGRMTPLGQFLSLTVPPTSYPGFVDLGGIASGPNCSVWVTEDSHTIVKIT